MFLKSLLIFGTLFILSSQATTTNNAEFRNASEIGKDGQKAARTHNFEYQTSYNGVVLTMKDELIAQLKNTMLSAVLDQEFMQNLLSNYWSIAPPAEENTLERQDMTEEANERTSHSLVKMLSEGQFTKFQDIAMEYISEIGKVNCAVKKMVLDKIKLNIEKTHITPINSTSAFDFKIQNLGLNFLFQYDMMSDIEIMKDAGFGSAVFDDISLSFDLSLYLDHKRMHVNVDRVNLKISELNLILQSEAFSDIINQYIGQFRSFIEDQLQIQFSRVIKQGTQVILNQMFLDLQDSIHLKFPDIYMNNLIRENDKEFKFENDFLTLLYDGTWYREQDQPIFNSEEITLPRFSHDGKDLQLYISQQSMQSALLSSLKNEQVSQRTLWLNVDKLEDVMGGIKENFGDDFQFIKVIVQAQSIENAKLTVTAEHGVIIELTNKYIFENPRVTLDGSDDEENEADELVPFMEMEISHKLHTDLSQISSEVIDFSISSIDASIMNYGIYYQCETELPTDDEARQQLLNLVNDLYISEVNSVKTQVQVDESQESNDTTKAQINLPIHSMLLKSIDNIEISVFDGFILFEADPKSFGDHHALVDFKMKQEMEQSREQSQNELTVQVDTLKDLFGHINANIMNVYEITKNTLQKSVVKRIPDTSYEEAAATIGQTTWRDIQDGINYIQEIVGKDDL